MHVISLQIHLSWLASADQQRAFLDEHAAITRDDIALVSPDLPLRANLSVLDNIALIPQFRHNLKYDQAADMAWSLLESAGHQACHAKRDPALTHTERFVAKLLRATIAQPPIILIDRPAMLLPEVNYPPVLLALLKQLESRLNTCWIIDYQWNRVLYDADTHFPEISPLLP